MSHDEIASSLGCTRVAAVLTALWRPTKLSRLTAALAVDADDRLYHGQDELHPAPCASRLAWRPSFFIWLQSPICKRVNIQEACADTPPGLEMRSATNQQLPILGLIMLSVTAPTGKTIRAPFLVQKFGLGQDIVVGTNYLSQLGYALRAEGEGNAFEEGFQDASCAPTPHHSCQAV